MTIDTTAHYVTSEKVEWEGEAVDLALFASFIWLSDMSFKLLFFILQICCARAMQPCCTSWYFSEGAASLD